MYDAAPPHPLLRQEVAMLRARESRRVFDTAVHVGRPAGARDSFVVRAIHLPVMDPALRTDVVEELVSRTAADHTSVWLTRPGGPYPHDLDLAWLAAATLAFGVHGRPLEGFWTITRAGWLDVRTGENRVWKRLRA
ncbi:MAG TPA: hypothetical protein VFG97_06580 [Pedococcus sp.]|nr:hypothetical protein [Pedococcus sp.]